MIKQLRASGGIWISCRGTNVLLDPGPGSIVRCSSARPRLDPSLLDGIILTHRHLDHANDINVMIEAMTEGGFKKRGIVFCPQDALFEDPVILKHARNLPQEIRVLKEKSKYKVGNFSFRTSIKHVHPAYTVGLRFKLGNSNISLITDTKYFDGLADAYKKTDTLIISVVFFEPRPTVDHLSLAEAGELIRQIKPKRAILTHFGMTMLKARPHIQAEILTQKLKVEVLAAYDGMTLHF